LKPFLRGDKKHRERSCPWDVFVGFVVTLLYMMTGPLSSEIVCTKKIFLLKLRGRVAVYGFLDDWGGGTLSPFGAAPSEEGACGGGGQLPLKREPVEGAGSSL